MVGTLDSATGRIETAGLVDAHSHLRSTSLSDHGLSAESLEEGLLRMMAMTPVDVEDDAFVAASDLVAAGVTGVQVMFHTFGDPDLYLETLCAVARGIARSGIRALVILGATDQAEFLPLGVSAPEDFPSFAAPAREMNPQQFVESVTRARAMDLGVELGVGPVGAQWCSDELMEAIASLAGPEIRVHSHLLESALQRSWSGENPLDRLERWGLLGAHTSLAHGVWCSREELVRLRDAGATLVTCPASNRTLRAGVADYGLWHEVGVTTALGLDSIDRASVPWLVARSVFDEDDALAVLTRGGIAATGLACDSDRVVWADFHSGVVDHVQIDGRELVRDGVLVQQAEVEDARSRVLDTLSKDLPQRTLRHSHIDGFLPHYHRVLEAVR